MTTLIKNVTVVSDGKSLKTNVLIEDGFFVNVDADNEALQIGRASCRERV